MREEGVLLPQVGRLFWVVLRPKMGKHLPLFWREPAKNNKLMLAGNAAKRLEIAWKFLLV
jgi:hypothetical protein